MSQFEQRAMDDHDAVIMLMGKVQALIELVEANEAASRERDGRIEGKVDKINGGFREHDRKLSVLWTDRTIWNWVLRLFVIATPLIVAGANYVTSK